MAQSVKRGRDINASWRRRADLQQFMLLYFLVLYPDLGSIIWGQQLSFSVSKRIRDVWNFRDSRGEIFWTVDGRFCVRMAPCKGFVMTATCTQIAPITGGCLEADWGNDGMCGQVTGPHLSLPFSSVNKR